MSAKNTRTPGELRLKVRVKPRASKSRVLGLKGDELEVAVAAPPVDGAANLELIRTLADHYGVAKSAVEIVSGETGRHKIVRIVGAS
jgi:uncharacterized protein (TIGR00251 family)